MYFFRLSAPAPVIKPTSSLSIITSDKEVHKAKAPDAILRSLSLGSNVIFFKLLQREKVFSPIILIRAGIANSAILQLIKLSPSKITLLMNLQK